MAGAKGKTCPIRVTNLPHSERSGESCAWWCEFAQECAVPLVAGVLADSTICQNIFFHKEVNTRNCEDCMSYVEHPEDDAGECLERPVKSGYDGFETVTPDWAHSCVFFRNKRERR